MTSISKRWKKIIRSKSHKIINLYISHESFRSFPSIEMLLNKTVILNVNFAKRTWTILGFQFFICILKVSMLLAFFNLSGNMFQILGPRNEILSYPWYTVLIGRIVNWEFFLRWQCCSFLCSKSSVSIKGDRSFFILYISVARIWRFRLWTETEPSFSNSVSNDDCLSEYIIRKQRSCSLFILPLLARLWHIHTRRQ